jgi:nitrate reductase NapA
VRRPRSCGTSRPAGSTRSPATTPSRCGSASARPKAEGGDITPSGCRSPTPGQTLPNRDKLFDPSRKDPDKFLIVLGRLPDRDHRIADLVLPSACGSRRTACSATPSAAPSSGSSMVNPPGPGARRLLADHRRGPIELYRARHPGMRDRRALSCSDFADGAARCPCGSGPLLRRERRRGLFEEYRPFTALQAQRPRALRRVREGPRPALARRAEPDGVWRETRFRFARATTPTSSRRRRMQFYHSTSNDDRAQIWFHPHENPPEMPDARVPLLAVHGARARALAHGHDDRGGSPSSAARCRRRTSR